MTCETFEKENSRKSWLDLGRGISILLVILFHSENTVAITGFHWTTKVAPFRMPLFFFISGYLFTSDHSHFSISKKLSQIFRGIVIPYLIFTSILVVPKTLFHGMTLEDGLKEIFMGWASWFVVALCGAQIIFAICLNCTKKTVRLLIFSICLISIGLWVHSIYPHRLPFYLNYSLLIAPFFFAGFIYRIYEYKITTAIHRKWTAIVLPVLYFAFIIFDITYLKTDLSLFNDKLTSYRNIYLSLTYSFLGVFMMVTLLKMMPSIPLIEYIGKNSLIYYYLNGACLKFCNTIANTLKFNHLKLPEYAIVFVFLIITTITIYYICRFIRKYCPLLTGDKSTFKSLKTRFTGLRKISDIDFRYIDLTKSIMTILVVIIHIPVYYHNNIFDIFLKIVPLGICQIAVPSFFLVSGFLFKPDLTNIDAFRKKYQTRLFSLALPYLLWNTLAILIIVIPHLDVYHNITVTNSLALFWDTSHSFIHTTGTTPIDYPLWYIRDLILCLMVFPLIFLLTKYLSWVSPLILIFLWISGYDITGISLISVSFFTIGYWLRQIHFNIFFNRTITTILFSCTIICLIINLHINNLPLFRIGICCGALSVFSVTRWIFTYTHRFTRIFTNIFTPSFVFFLYCIHALYLNSLGNLIHKYLFNIISLKMNLFTSFMYYFSLLIITIFIAYSIFKTGNLLCSNTIKILTGNRIRKQRFNENFPTNNC